MNAPPALESCHTSATSSNSAGRIQEIYVSGEYLKKNPAWHIEEAPWKVKQIVKMLAKHNLRPESIGEIGCGAGEVLRQLQAVVDGRCRFEGFDISPQAIQLCQARANDRLQFRLGDGADLPEFSFDVVLVLDVLEHLEDYFSFLRRIRNKGRVTLFHIPLDISVQTVVRPYGLLKRRDLYYHLHYFTKETALRTLQDAGYAIVDCAFTPRNLDMPANAMHWLLKPFRKLFFAIRKDLAVRVLGGYSLLVLTR